MYASTNNNNDIMTSEQQLGSCTVYNNNNNIIPALRGQLLVLRFGVIYYIGCPFCLYFGFFFLSIHVTILLLYLQSKCLCAHANAVVVVIADTARGCRYSWPRRPTSCVRVYYYYYYYRYPRFIVRLTVGYFEQHCFRCPVFVPARPVTVHLYGAQEVIPLNGINFISGDSFYDYYYLKFRRFRLPTLSPIVVLLVKAVFWWQSVLELGAAPLLCFYFFLYLQYPNCLFLCCSEETYARNNFDWNVEWMKALLSMILYLMNFTFFDIIKNICPFFLRFEPPNNTCYLYL